MTVIEIGPVLADVVRSTVMVIAGVVIFGAFFGRGKTS